MPQLTPKGPRTIRLALRRAVFPLFLLLVGTACAKKPEVTPAEATCEGACAAMPTCGSPGEDAGCIAACKTAQANCANEYRSTTFQESLACLTNASYSCEEADYEFNVPTTTDCQNLQSYVAEGTVMVGCTSGVHP